MIGGYLHFIALLVQIILRHSQKKQSIAYFQNPNYDANISCLPTCVESDDKVKYRDIKAGQYLMQNLGNHRLKILFSRICGEYFSSLLRMNRYVMMLGQ